MRPIMECSIYGDIGMTEAAQHWRHRTKREPILKISRPLRKTQGFLSSASERLRPYREKSSARIKESIKARMAKVRAAKTEKHRARIRSARKKKKKKKKSRRR